MADKSAAKDEWRPISEAPKDGTVLIGIDHIFDYPSVHFMQWREAGLRDDGYDYDAGWYCPHETDFDIHPTHWIEFPSLPRVLLTGTYQNEIPARPER